MSDAKNKVRQFITEELGIDLTNLNDDSPLFTSGAIDSFALIEVLAFLEQDFDIEIDIADIDIDQIDTVSSLAGLAK